MTTIQAVLAKTVTESPKGHRLSPEELGLLAKRLANAKNPDEAARLREAITRGFYGI